MSGYEAKFQKVMIWTYRVTNDKRSPCWEWSERDKGATANNAARSLLPTSLKNVATPPPQQPPSSSTIPLSPHLPTDQHHPAPRLRLQKSKSKIKTDGSAQQWQWPRRTRSGIAAAARRLEARAHRDGVPDARIAADPRAPRRAGRAGARGRQDGRLRGVAPARGRAARGARQRPRHAAAARARACLGGAVLGGEKGAAGRAGHRWRARRVVLDRDRIRSAGELFCCVVVRARFILFRISSLSCLSRDGFH